MCRCTGGPTLRCFPFLAGLPTPGMRRGWREPPRTHTVEAPLGPKVKEGSRSVPVKKNIRTNHFAMSDQLMHSARSHHNGAQPVGGTHMPFWAMCQRVYLASKALLRGLLMVQPQNNVDVPRGCSTIVGRQTRHCAPTLCKEVTAATPARLPFPNGCRRDTVRMTHRWTGQSRRRGTCVQHPDFEGTETRVSMMIRHAANGSFAAGGRKSKPSRCSHFAAPVKCTRASTQLRRSLSTLR